MELIKLLKAIPVQVRVAASLLAVLPVIFVVSRRLGLSAKLSWVLVAGLIGICLLLILLDWLVRMQQRRQAAEFETSLRKESERAEVDREEVRGALRELSVQWRGALAELRGAGLSIYELPWYLLIGEPQSGKSTTLKNSGLEFPVGHGALSGAGGTRNCDWWFSNEAVILDTAGRFTFQEETAPDRYEWASFLRLLKRHRRYCPINGVILGIPATSLLEEGPEEQLRKAKNIRNKLLHLQRTLEIRFPVFVLVTKCDRILGFADFFHRLEPAQKQQLFGWSDHDSREKTWSEDGFKAAFRSIVGRTKKLRLRFLSQERDTKQIDRLFVFPEELEALEEPLGRYLMNIFGASRYEEPFLVRGFYLTSGVQEGRPVARACRELLEVRPGESDGVLENLESVFGRSRPYFIRDFYREKVFPEQGLVSRTRAAQQKHRTFTWSMRGLMVTAALAGLLLLLPAALQLHGIVAPANERVEAARVCLDQPASQCGFTRALDFVARLEDSRREMRAARWTMRRLLQGGVRNEITEQLRPAIQGALLRERVLPSLFESFNRRTGRELWREANVDYPTFLRAHESLLFSVHYNGPNGERPGSESLRRKTSLEALGAFCLQTRGRDPSPVGDEIDRWFGEDEVRVHRLAAWFDSALRSNRVDVLELTGPPDARSSDAAFREYWSVRQLARWDHELLEYLERYQQVHDELLRLGSGGARADEVLAGYQHLVREFAENWRRGREHMARGSRGAKAAGAGDEGGDKGQVLDRPGIDAVVSILREGPERPGEGAEQWQANCLDDFGRLSHVAPWVADREDAVQHCARIQDQYLSLVQARERYAYLLDRESSETGPSYAWTEQANGLATPYEHLASQITDEIRGRKRDEFEQSLAAAHSAQDRNSLIGAYYRGRDEDLSGPAKEFDALFGLEWPPSLDLAGLAIVAERASTLALAVDVVPGIATHFAESLRCDRCLSEDYARSHVRPASEFVSFAHQRLGWTLGFGDVASPLDDLGEAQVHYLDRLVETFDPGSSGAGLTFHVPHAAREAGTWRGFLAAIGEWQPLQDSGGAAAASGGLALATLEEFAQNNDRIAERLPVWRPLLNRRARGSGGGGPPAAARFAQQYKACVETLDSDPLRAWRALARAEGGASLDCFHTFTRAAGLLGTSANSLQRVEDHGARLLSEALAPIFRERSAGLLRWFDQCCRGRYPFVTQNDITRRRREVEQLAVVRDEQRREAVRSLDLDTVSMEQLDTLFQGPGRYAELSEDFALAPILDASERHVDFVREAKPVLVVLRAWHRFLYGEGPGDGLHAMSGQKVQVKLLPEEPGATSIPFLGTRVSRLDLFGEAAIRPTNPGGPREINLALDPQPVAVVGEKEGSDGWRGSLLLRGGPLKALYFVELVGSARSRGVWKVRLELPDFERPSAFCEGYIEVVFPRGAPLGDRS